MVRLQVPASSANLGPGFDCLGLALTRYLRCGFAPRDGGLLIEGCPPAYADDNNLIYRSFKAAAQALGMSTGSLHLQIDSQIPFSRGMGSSAAAIVAGIAGAWALAGLPFDRQAIFELADQLEGHPDNVSAAVYGGLRIALKEETHCLSLPTALNDAWHFTVLIPDFELSTQLARAALPLQLPRGDASYNVSHALALCHALAEGDMALLRLALRDRLHQPYRLPLIAGGEAVWIEAEALGAAVCISGAGPTLLCLHQQPQFSAQIKGALPSGWEALDIGVDRQGLSLL